MNLPNRLTVTRIALTPAVCLCMYAQKGCLWIAAALFSPIPSMAVSSSTGIAEIWRRLCEYGRYLLYLRSTLQ